MQPIASTHGKLLVWGLDASRPRRNCGNCRSVASRASDGAPDRGVFGQDFSMRWPNLVPCCVYRHWRGPYGLDDVAAKGRMPMSRALRKNLSAVGRGNKRSRICLAILPAAVLGLNACGDQATLPASAGFGPSPQLPPAHATLIPTVNIAPATGWQGGQARWRLRACALSPSPRASIIRAGSMCCRMAMSWSPRRTHRLNLRMARESKAGS